LTTIPEEINQLFNLQCLNLNNNKIRKIVNINNLVNLQRLELRSNKIEKMENLNYNKNLVLITLSCNLITEIKEEDISLMENLEELGLFGNYLGILRVFYFA